MASYFTNLILTCVIYQDNIIESVPYCYWDKFMDQWAWNLFDKYNITFPYRFLSSYTFTTFCSHCNLAEGEGISSEEGAKIQDNLE